MSWLDSIGDVLSTGMKDILPSASTMNTLSLLGNIGMGVYGYMQQKKQFEETANSIRESEAASQAALREQASQFDSKAREQMGEAARQSMIARAKAAAAASAGNVRGSTVDRLMNEQTAAGGMDIAMLQGNVDAYNRQIMREMAGIAAKSKNSIANLGPKPNVLSLVKPIVGAGMQYANNDLAIRRNSR